RLVAGERGGGLDIGWDAVLDGRLPLLEAEVVDPERPAPALPRRDRELDGAHLLRLPGLRGAPGEAQAGLPDGDALPVGGEGEVALVPPPDVLSRRVEELELEVVPGPLPAQVEGERVVLGQRERELLAHDDVAAARAEVEPDPHAHARAPGPLERPAPGAPGRGRR